MSAATIKLDNKLLATLNELRRTKEAKQEAAAT